ncbi:hypothetical protein RD792_017125 [Penstemon davidsonii]|uniref:STI1 domain-containing protein n=1 Tax=Penstemon davidsonii TaxID=160366 RepID=A0ABR0CLK4_9LAMI|nr:hypothetical protein RD792_017125 [Penstemon davidsonii]
MYKNTPASRRQISAGSRGTPRCVFPTPRCDKTYTAVFISSTKDPLTRLDRLGNSPMDFCEKLILVKSLAKRANITLAARATHSSSLRATCRVLSRAAACCRTQPRAAAAAAGSSSAVLVAECGLSTWQSTIGRDMADFGWTLILPILKNLKILEICDIRKLGVLDKKEHNIELDEVTEAEKAEEVEQADPSPQAVGEQEHESAPVSTPILRRAIQRGRELRSDYKMVAKALTRKGTALTKMAKTSKDYEPAIAVFQKSRTEHRDADTLKKLNDALKAKKYLEKQYEAIKRNPKDHKAYNNRAASYTKVGAMPEVLKGAEKCIELDPTFLKVYTRKGAVQFFMKEYEKALETYQAGLKHDPHNQELLDGVRRCVEQINKASRGDLTPDELKERQAKGMQDPEIQNILTDPVMRQVLSDFQENPKVAQEHMKNPLVMDKIQKLISAAIIQVK